MPETPHDAVKREKIDEIDAALRNPDHPVWSRHLPNSMREIDYPFL